MNGIFGRRSNAVLTRSPRIARDSLAGIRAGVAGELAFELGVPLPGTALATSLYLEARAHGEGSNGNQALFRVYDRLSNQEG